MEPISLIGGCVTRSAAEVVLVVLLHGQIDGGQVTGFGAVDFHLGHIQRQFGRSDVGVGGLGLL